MREILTKTATYVVIYYGIRFVTFVGGFGLAGYTISLTFVPTHVIDTWPIWYILFLTATILIGTGIAFLGHFAALAVAAIGFADVGTDAYVELEDTVEQKRAVRRTTATRRY